MKHLILIALLIPFTSSGQLFVVSEQAGYSATSKIATYRLHGISDEVSVGYHFTPHFLVGIFHEYNQWNAHYSFVDDERQNDPLMGDNHSFGIFTDFISKYFSVGLNIENTKFSTMHQLGNFGYKDLYDDFSDYKNSICFGIHAGSKQRIYHNLFLNEHIGYNYFEIEGTGAAVLFDKYGLYLGKVPLRESFSVFYCRVGLSYELSFHKSKKKKVPRKVDARDDGE